MARYAWLPEVILYGLHIVRRLIYHSLGGSYQESSCKWFTSSVNVLHSNNPIYCNTFHLEGLTTQSSNHLMRYARKTFSWVRYFRPTVDISHHKVSLADDFYLSTRWIVTAQSWCLTAGIWCLGGDISYYLLLTHVLDQAHDWESQIISDQDGQLKLLIICMETLKPPNKFK
jgi:hypothetical protein